MKNLVITLAIIVLFPTLALAADVTMTWEASTGATGYKIQVSSDAGTTWGEVRDAGNVTAYTWLAAPATGLHLFRVSAYNSSGEAIRTHSGVWYCGEWTIPAYPAKVGVE
jgi:nitrogen fixation protein FixH